MVRFSINWGERSGAAPNRLLGHICRRGDIRGNQVGAIDIGGGESTFEVAEAVAGRFEKLVSKVDPRDPKLRIVRAGAAGGPDRGREKPRPSGRPKRRFIPKGKGRR